MKRAREFKRWLGFGNKRCKENHRGTRNAEGREEISFLCDSVAQIGRAMGLAFALKEMGFMATVWA